MGIVSTLALGAGTGLASYLMMKTVQRVMRQGLGQRIFVAIANYRDPEIEHTLADLFAKAARPERVVAGVLDQVLPGERYSDPPTFGGRIRRMRMDSRESGGACWARHLLFEKLLGDEEYVLQIDSHSRFEQGWDERLLSMLDSCPRRSVLSKYPVGYHSSGTLDVPSICPPVPAYFSDQGVLGIQPGRAIRYEARPSRPILNSCIVAGFIFAPRILFKEVPYDPHLYFYGEEASLSARYWTHGWDIYVPNDVVVYHLYGRESSPRHWTDHAHWHDREVRSTARFRHLFGIERASDPLVTEGLHLFGLGSKRSLSDYERFIDVRFNEKIVGPRAMSWMFDGLEC